MNRVLTVAPHPDDETLGGGGTLLRHKAEGDEIHWLIFTEISEASGFEKGRVELRQKEIDRVGRAYGFSSIHQAGFLTSELDCVPKKTLIEKVESVFNNIKPDTIYLPYRGDVHSDHEVVFDVCASCIKIFRYSFVRRVLAYETLSETEFGVRPGESGFKPNLWIDVTSYIEKKIEIMKMYAGEMGEHPFPRSASNIRALATLRGARSGKQAAEAFMILQEIQ